MNNTAFIFPGQGSQKVGMLAKLMAAEPLVINTLTEASDLINLDILSLIKEGPAETLNLTENTQPILLTASVALWRLWQQKGGAIPEIMAGHSLGEYSALVCSEALSFADALHLVKKRGLYMQEAVPENTGAMAAVLGLDDSEIIEICDKVMHTSDATVSAANFNAPGQVVIAGHKQAVNAALPLFKEKGARVIPLPVSVPSHCKLMEPAAKQLAEDLQKVSVEPPKIPVIQNVVAEVVSDPEVIRNNLVQQLYKPVLWSASVQKIADRGITKFYECGPGKVLAGLNKRIINQVSVATMESELAFEK